VRADCATIRGMKDELIKARVSARMKDAIARIAKARGESEAVIIREALNSLVMNDAATSGAAAPASVAPVSYLKPKAIRRTK